MFHFNIQAPWRMCHAAHYSKTSPLVTYWHLSLARPLRHHFSYRFQEFPKRIEAADGPRQFPLVVPSPRGRGHAVQVKQTLCLEHLSAQYPVGFWGNSAPLSKHDACGEKSSRWGEAAGETVQVFCNSMMLNSISLSKVNFSFGLTHHQGSRAFWKCEITGTTGWSKETVNCNLYLMELKSTKDGLAQWFFSRKFREVLIFWCLKRARWKKMPYFRVVPKWCVFQTDLVTVLLKGGS